MKAMSIYVRAAAAAGASFLLLAPATAQSQFDILKKAKQAIEERVPSLESVFGNGPVITTSIEDAHDGVALLDGFTPKSYSPLLEMPRAQDGKLILVPGAYAGMLQSFCLKPGTYGPQRGEGYLHAEWEGPKADLISTVIMRYGERRDIEQYDVQKLLWAIIARADMKKIDRELQVTAARLLTPSELLELSGYSLNAVPDAVGKRVLEKAPAAVRQILEAENKMRRMFQSAETRYADLEQLAVLSGSIPEAESQYKIPSNRWSYHPAGFFIRYDPKHYSLMRVDIYYPDKVEIRRDGSGRIISIASSDGRRVEPHYPGTATAQLVSAFAAPTSRLDLVVRAMRWAPGDARQDLLMLAQADYMDLAAIQRGVEPASASRNHSSIESEELVRDAMHAALLRYIGISRLQSLDRGSELEASLRPKVTLDGFTYMIGPVVARKPGMMLGPEWYGPTGGGGVAPGQRQRLGPSLGMKGPPPELYGGSGPPPDDALDKAQKATDLLSALNDAKDFFTGGWLDKGNMAANKAADRAFGPYSAMTSPSGMLGAGMQQAFNAARTIGNSMAGDDGSWIPRLTPGHEVGTTRAMQPLLIPVNFTPMRMMGAPVHSRTSRLDYRTLSKPRTIEFRPFTFAQNPAHAQATNALIRSTFRTAMLLEAWGLAERRMAEAVKARDEEWQEKQGRAIIHLKRATGLAMIQYSEDLASARRTAPPGALVTEEEVREGQRRLGADGYAPDVVDVASKLGMTGAELEARRRRVLAMDPVAVASQFPTKLQTLEDALLRYGKHLALVPEVKAPWETVIAQH